MTYAYTHLKRRRVLSYHNALRPLACYSADDTASILFRV